LLTPLRRLGKFTIVGVLRHKPIGHTQSIIPGTGPRIVPRKTHQGRFQWISLNIPATTEQVALTLNHRALEPALKPMPNKAVATVTVVNIGTQQPGHQSRKVPGVLKLQEKVNMIGHEAIIVKAKAKPVPVASDQVQEGALIGVVGKNGLAVVVAVHQMVAGLPGPLEETGQTRHGPGLHLGKEFSPLRSVPVYDQRPGWQGVRSTQPRFLPVKGVSRGTRSGKRGRLSVQMATQVISNKRFM
jgi:hypothetical protein